jgi:hypothetical protein
MTQVDFVNTSVTLGELMRAQRRDAVRAFAVFLAVVLYAAVLVYTGVHNFNLLSRTVPPDQRFFAIIALLCLEGAAVFLPLAIHFWLAPGPQRLVGYILYGLNFAVVMLNTVLDAFTQRAEQLPDWLQLYAAFVLPASPVFIGIGIAFLFLLDPSKKLHDARAAAQAASMDALALHMREAANRPDVNAALQQAALKDVQATTSQVTGLRVLPKTAPALPKATANGRSASARRAARARKRED